MTSEEDRSSMCMRVDAGGETERIMVEMLDKAKTIVWMSGSLHHALTRTAVADAFKHSAERVPDCRLLLEPGSNIETSLDEFPWLVELIEREFVRVRKSKEPIPQQLIVDEQHMMLAGDASSRKVAETPATIWNVPRIISDVVCDHYLGHWDHAKPILGSAP